MSDSPGDSPGLEPESAPGVREVLGLDNVRLELPLAGPVSRLAAVVVDAAIVVALLLLVGLLAVVALLSLKVSPRAILAIVGVLSFLAQWGYFAGLELAMAGQTPGKRLVGLRVASRLGGRPSVATILVRNLLRSVDVVVGVPLLLFEPRGRRLGDLVAGSLVLHVGPERHPDDDPLRVVPESWGQQEVTVVAAFLERAPWLDEARAHELARRLVEILPTAAPAVAAWTPARP